MIKNIFNPNEFKNLKKTVDTSKKVNELVEPYGNQYKVTVDVFIDKSTINKFASKVKDQTGKDIKSTIGEMRIAEIIANWVNGPDGLVNVDDNLPVTIITGGAVQKPQAQSAQGQVQPPQTQPQAQAQPPQSQPPIQDENSAQAQPAAAPTPQPSAQDTADQVPPQEI